MNRLLTALLLCAASIACTQDALTSPQEVILIVDTNIVLSEHDAMVAVRGRSMEPPEALVHVECEGTDVTLIARQLEQTEEACGLQFELGQLRITDGEVNAVVLKLHFDDGRESEVPLEASGEAADEEGEGSAEAGAEEAAVPAEAAPAEAAPEAAPAEAAPASQPQTGVTTTQPSPGLVAGEGSGAAAPAGE